MSYGSPRSCGYPDFLAHHSEHECLAYAVLEFYQKLMSNEMGMTADTVAFLKGWLRKKILGVDMKFAPFLKGKGVPWRQVLSAGGWGLGKTPAPRT